MIQTISKSWSIRWKLTHIAMTTTTFALLLTIFGLAIFEYFSLRQHIKGELQMLGQIVGGNSTAAIAFNRPDDATATLATLEAHQGIRAACIYDADGKILATYQAREEVGVIFEPHPRPPGLYFSARYLDIYQPVQLDGKTIGTVFLHSDLGQLNERIMLYAWVSPLILVAASGFGLLLVNQLQRQVSAPITSLAQTSRRISQENNYTLRASKFSDDELGQLADAFNHMVEGIRRRDEQIQSHLEDVKAARDQLEARVEARTADLKLANAELQAQMEHRREAERKRAEMQSNLVEASRRAGMADVATGVLHNVGNVLNSVNVSTQIVHDTVKASRVSTLVKAAELLQEHGADLPGFFAADARARALPEFFSKLSQALAREQATLLNEVDGLASNIAHIREIVAMQQSLSRVSGVHSAVTLGELIEDAVKINHAGLSRHQVTLEREFDPERVVAVDRHKVLQILINLVSNAKYAVNGNVDSPRCIRLRARVCDQQLTIDVIDNGIGIAPEQMSRIFGFGFTTKKEGHGFGLHSSALAAREMGGSLRAHSDGPGAGATFTLTVPLTKEPLHV